MTRSTVFPEIHSKQRWVLLFFCLSMSLAVLANGKILVQKKTEFDVNLRKKVKKLGNWVVYAKTIKTKDVNLNKRSLNVESLIDFKAKEIVKTMDLSSWESTIGATSSSFMSKVQQMTDSLTGKSGGEDSKSNSKPTAIPFSSNPESSQSNDEVWLLGRKYFSQTGKILVLLTFLP